MKLALVQLKGQDISAYESAYRSILAQLREACQTDADMILLPECAYPGYFIGVAADDAWQIRVEQLLDEIGKAAAGCRKYVAVGVAYPCEGKLFNSLVVFDRGGKILNRWDKSNLWHFDCRWFSAGTDFSVFETEFGVVGAMVCADGRIPEIARILRLKGAKLILDSVNLVANASSPQQLLNQQYAFMLRTRAMENGVFIAACNKCGVEDGAVTMAGRSFVVDPRGEIVAECSPDKQEILLCEVDLNYESPLPGRRPELYGVLAEATEKLPVYREQANSHNLSDLEYYTAVARFPANSREDYLRQAEKRLLYGQLLGAKLIVLPPAGSLLSSHDLLSLCSCMKADAAAVGCCSDSGVNKAVFFNKEGCAGELTQSHLDSEGRAIETLQLFDGMRVAALFGLEMHIPEVSRVAALMGADLLLWFDSCGNRDYFNTMRTRASENRVFVLRATPFEGNDCSALVSPDGVMVCTTFSETEHLVAGMVYTALSKCKTVVPGTHIVKGRIPEAYRLLIEPRGE